MVTVGLALLAWWPGTIARGQQPPPAPAPPDYARDVVPILEANCVRCHSPAQQEAGLLVDTYEDLMRGGDDGQVVAPGKAASSRLITLVEGRAKPKMPPKSDLRPQEIATLRAWIDAGARYSPPVPFTLDGKVPDVPQQAALLPEVPSLAFRAGGNELAIAGYKEVRRVGLTPAARPLAPFGGLDDQVRSLAFSADGSRLAAAGGTPGATGEITIFDAASGKVLRRLSGHRDYVYQVAFSHDGRRLASCGYDKSVRIWDVESGRLLSVLREHTDAVFAVAFSPDDAWLASGAGDRAVKIWDAAKGVRLFTLTDATDAVTTLQFHPSGRTLTAAGADKTMRTWQLEDTGGRLVRSVIAHTAPVLALAYAPGGAWIASAAADRTVKIWNAGSGDEVRTLERQSDWAQGLAWSSDGSRLAVGRYDGTVALYDPRTGRRVRDVVTGAGAAAAVRAARR